MWINFSSSSLLVNNFIKWISFYLKLISKIILMWPTAWSSFIQWQVTDPVKGITGHFCYEYVIIIQSIDDQQLNRYHMSLTLHSINLKQWVYRNDWQANMSLSVLKHDKSKTKAKWLLDDKFVIISNWIPKENNNVA